MFKFGRTSKNRLTGVHPDLVLCAHNALDYGVIDFTIVSGVRTKAQQEALYQQGRSGPGKIVTWTMDSRHLLQDDGYGHALDVAPYVDGGIDWNNTENFYILSTIMFRSAMELGVELEWGGFWKKPDMPHFQLKENDDV